jgi:hypothetical protein
MLPVDFCMTLNNLFEEIIFDISKQKLFLYTKSKKKPSVEVKMKTPNLSTTCSFTQAEDQENFSPMSFKKQNTLNNYENESEGEDSECYSMTCKNIKIKKIFRFSIYFLIQLKYKKKNLLKKNVQTYIYLAFFNLEDLKYTLSTLEHSKINYNLDMRVQIDGLIKQNLQENTNYFSQKNQTLQRTAYNLALSKSKIYFKFWRQKQN